MHKAGAITRMPDGRAVLRPKNAPTPCESCPKPPQWAKSAGYDYHELRRMASESGGELSIQHRESLDFYRQCKGIGWNTPSASDPIVQWFAGIVRSIEDQYNRDKASEPGEYLPILIELIARRLR